MRLLHGMLVALALLGMSQGARADAEPKKLEISGVKKKAALVCEPGAKVVVSGTGHELTLTGECGALEVSGTNNKLVTEVAAKIEVSGVGNKITWTRGKGGKDPEVKTTGVNNSVVKAEKK